MGNKLGRRRQVVDEQYTRPQGLYDHKDVDHKKLRKLILESKLAPCYPGEEECIGDLEECPICFLFYRSLNRSRCCMKSICTECFLQMKVPNSTHPTQCPFCKTVNYAVEYRGVKTKEEKGLEQIEEQRVIEAQIRIRQQELRDDEERLHKGEGINAFSSSIVPEDVGDSLNAALSSISVVENEDLVSAHESCITPVVRTPPASRGNRDGDFDLDLEDFMIMEAIWLSIQENGRSQNVTSGDALPGQLAVDNWYVSHAVSPQTGSSSSPSGGLACAIAVLAECQKMGGDSSVNSADGNTSTFQTLPGSSRVCDRMDRAAVDLSPAENLNEIVTNGRATVHRNHVEWGLDHVSEFSAESTTYADCNAVGDTSRISSLPQDDAEESNENTRDHIIPDSYEEQMLLAMAVSLAEAGATSDGNGGSW